MSHGDERGSERCGQVAKVRGMERSNNNRRTIEWQLNKLKTKEIFLRNQSCISKISTKEVGASYTLRIDNALVIMNLIALKFG